MYKLTITANGNIISLEQEAPFTPSQIQDVMAVAKLSTPQKLGDYWPNMPNIPNTYSGTTLQAPFEGVRTAKMYE